jgi:hypothetical protein
MTGIFDCSPLKNSKRVATSLHRSPNTHHGLKPSTRWSICLKKIAFPSPCWDHSTMSSHGVNLDVSPFLRIPSLLTTTTLKRSRAVCTDQKPSKTSTNAKAKNGTPSLTKMASTIAKMQHIPKFKNFAATCGWYIRTITFRRSATGWYMFRRSLQSNLRSV